MNEPVDTEIPLAVLVDGSTAVSYTHRDVYKRQSYGSKWQVDAMQCHPVQFLFPTFPIPKCHGVGVGAVIEIVTQGQICFVAFFTEDENRLG